MEPIQTKHTFRVDLDQCPVTAELPRPLSHSDALADEIVVAVRRGQSPVTLSGMTALATLTYATRQTLPLEGRVAGNCAIIPLPAAAYTVPGAFRLCVQLQSGDVRHTLLHLSGQMAATSTDALISSGDLLPTLPELLSQIDGMHKATEDARQAALESRNAADALTLRVSTAVADMAAAVNQAAPAIMAEASGAVAVCSDAASRPAVAVVTTLLPQQSGDGTPSADNVRPILPHTAAALYHAESYAEEAAACASLTLPDVYGGLLDWASGQLTVTHHSITLDSTRLYWIPGSANYYVEVADMAHGVPPLCDCCLYVKKAGTQLALGELTLGSVYAGKQRVCFGNPGNAITHDEWIAMRDAQPIQMVYEIKEPYTVQLNAHQISLLRGSNALWSDAGVTSLAYIADTRLYIDNAVAALAAAIINT